MIEAIPNVSEGRRERVARAIVDAVGTVPGAHLLDYSSDAAHHRAVATVAGDAAAVQDAVLRLFEVAVGNIDLRRHRGVHPRLGAVDVVPLVPLADTPMDVCVELAQVIGAEVAERFGIPVILYEQAASAPHRRRLEAIRRGGFEALATKLADPAWKPDYGPVRPHPTAGATVVGARGPLIAFNVNLASHDIEVARAVARQVRARSGGLPAVKALGVRTTAPGHDGVQVSMNLTDYRQTSLARAVTEVTNRALARGVRVAGTELIGLIPAEAVTGQTLGGAVRDLIPPDRILEARLARGRARQAPPSAAR